MGVDISDFIHVYHDALPQHMCDVLIKYFENNERLHETVKFDDQVNFTQLNLTENRSKLEDLHKSLIDIVIKYRNQYYNYVHEEVFPSTHALEQFRIKRYLPNGIDKFGTHVDVTDKTSCARFLSFFWYLNDVHDGGKTIFYDKIITPQKGTLVVFPPTWMFPHMGEPPLSGPKYLLSTYLHYKD